MQPWDDELDTPYISCNVGFVGSEAKLPRNHVLQSLGSPAADYIFHNITGLAPYQNDTFGIAVLLLLLPGAQDFYPDIKI